MTYADAMRTIKQGHPCRDELTMQPGWMVRRIGPDLYNINPHTGSNYGFTPTEPQRKSKDWRRV